MKKQYKISNGTGVGVTRITSFDKALIEAGVGNYNLVRLSSILPLGSEEAEKVNLPLGSLLPIAYAVYETTKPVRISAAVAIGFPVDNDDEHCAVIMEYEGECSQEEAERTVLNMVREGFYARGWELASTKVSSASAVGSDGAYTTVFACVAEWSE